MIRDLLISEYSKMLKRTPTVITEQRKIFETTRPITIEQHDLLLSNNAEFSEQR